jgi:hypothetical protein
MLKRLLARLAIDDCRFAALPRVKTLRESAIRKAPCFEYLPEILRIWDSLAELSEFGMAHRVCTRQEVIRLRSYFISQGERCGSPASLKKL